MANNLLKDAEVAPMLDLKHPGTLRLWRLKGKGPKYLKIGHKVRYRRETVEAWLAAQERTSTSDQPDEHAAA
jgi:hypothetical protein